MNFAFFRCKFSRDPDFYNFLPIWGPPPFVFSNVQGAEIEKTVTICKPCVSRPLLYCVKCIHQYYKHHPSVCIIAFDHFDEFHHLELCSETGSSVFMLQKGCWMCHTDISVWHIYTYRYTCVTHVYMCHIHACVTYIYYVFNKLQCFQHFASKYLKEHSGLSVGK